MTYIDVISCDKGYHVYKNVWKPRLQEQAYGEIEPNNPVDKYVVVVKKDGKNSWASTTKKKWKICMNDFLRADLYGKCNITVTGKAVNLGDGDRMQVPCVLRLPGQKSMVEILKQQPSLKWLHRLMHLRRQKYL